MCSNKRAKFLIPMLDFALVECEIGLDCLILKACKYILVALKFVQSCNASARKIYNKFEHARMCSIECV